MEMLMRTYYWYSCIARPQIGLSVLCALLLVVVGGTAFLNPTERAAGVIYVTPGGSG